MGNDTHYFSKFKCVDKETGEPVGNRKYYAISPNRMKSMNDYRVGRWYPQDKRYKFIDGNI